MPANARPSPWPAPSIRAGQQIDRRTPISDLPEYLTVEELREYLSMGRTAAYEFARAHGVRVGRLLRVPREALPRRS